jgi:cytochrome c oxidase cbb3-type subunit I/II
MRLRSPAALAALVCLSGCGKGPELPPLGDAVLERGRTVYLRYCSGCHGEKGDGKGPAARFLDPRPRDFTRGQFKFRSTPSGSLPTDDDLLRILSHGVRSTSMPAWRLLPREEQIAVVRYLQTLSPRWKDPRARAPALALPGPPDFVGTDPSIRRGGTWYAKMRCGECHGEGGRGDGPAVKTLRDDEGHPIVPLDFTARMPKGGDSAADYYRAFATGLDGTPMPEFRDSLPENERWDLVSYVMALRKYRGVIPAHLKAPPEPPPPPAPTPGVQPAPAPPKEEKPR